MNILLSGEFEAGEFAAWLRHLNAALPDARWLDHAQALAVADTIEVAVVANPAPGSLRGLPRLRLIRAYLASIGCCAMPRCPAACRSRAWSIRR